MVDYQNVGEKAFDLAQELFPICRSITGQGVRNTLAIIQKHIPIQIHEVPTGTEVFDWTVPKEWNIKEAWIKNPKGEKIIDFLTNNLHLLNYSIPVHTKLSLNELKAHLHSLPEQPNLVPYRTSYYKEQWGFCLSHNQLEKLEDGEYEVFIDATLADGHLTFGELYIPGESPEEVLFTAHICHPSLANDNLSGIGVITFLAQHIAKPVLSKAEGVERKYSYRFLFIPGTIGSITWLSLNKEKTKNIKHGLVASLLGDSSNFTYKKSRKGDTEIDRIVSKVLKDSGHAHEVIDFFPYGYDERQFCSPGFNLAVGNLTRSQFGQYPEYHTCADNLDFIRPQYLQESFDIYRKVVNALENNCTYRSQNRYCEPQLGKRGLYDAIGGDSDRKALQMAMLWVLNLSDGKHSVLDIAERSKCSLELVVKICGILVEQKLLMQMDL